MQIIANFSYAGTSKYVSHAVDGDATVCGMLVNDLLARNGQEWEPVNEENFLGRERQHMVRDIGCLICKRLLTKRALDKGYALEKIESLTLGVLFTKAADTQPALCE